MGRLAYLGNAPTARFTDRCGCVFRRGDAGNLIAAACVDHAPIMARMRASDPPCGCGWITNNSKQRDEYIACDDHLSEWSRATMQKLEWRT